MYEGVRWLQDHPGEVVYVAGPMHGQPDHGYPVFHKAEARLWEFDVIPLSPARGGPPLDAIARAEERYGDFRRSPIYQAMMRRDMGFVLMSKAIFLLPGWKASTGASAEVLTGGVIGCRLFDGAWLLDPA